MDKKDYINNGVILASTRIELAESDKTVFDLLYRVTRGKRIPIDYSGKKESAYIKKVLIIYMSLIVASKVAGCIGLMEFFELWSRTL